MSRWVRVCGWTLGVLLVAPVMAAEEVDRSGHWEGESEPV